MKTRPPFSSPLPLCLAAACLLSGSAFSQTVVTTAADENDTPAGEQISLREAIRDTSSGGQITFDAALNGKLLVLTGGEMVVTGKTVSVVAAGGQTIETRGLSRVFRVAAGAGLNLTGLTLQRGKAPADGGAILNAGTLTLTDCSLRDNRAANGGSGTNGHPGNAPQFPGGADGIIPGFGGIGGAGAGGGAVSSNGSLTAIRCRFTGNTAGNGGTGGGGGSVPNSTGSYWSGGGGGNGGEGGSGGAIRSTGALQLTECIFEANSSGAGGTGGQKGTPIAFTDFGTGYGGPSGHGGAVYQSGSASAERCSFLDNACPPGGLPGGGATRGGYSGSGAAVFWSSGTATLTNCTIAGNRTGEGSLGSSGERGGAIAGENGTLLRLVHCTVTRNLAARVRPGSAYDAWVTSTAAGIVSTTPVQCDNCILSGNLADRSTDNGGPVWQEINFSPLTTRTVNPATLGGTPGETPQLGQLVLSGGPLPLLLPKAVSPALNAGVVLTNPPAVDQRGLPRAEGVPDLGAVEVQASESTPLTPQSIIFTPPAQVQLTALPLETEVTAAASSGLPVSLELVSGPATLSGNTLTFTATGMVVLKALQAGNGTTAPAPSVMRVIEASGILQTIPFTAAESYPVYASGPAAVTLPAETSAGHPVTWSFTGSPVAGISLNGNVVTAASTGSLQIKGHHAGAGLYAPVTSTWTLVFTTGVVWWDTPPYEPLIPLPRHYVVVEGSSHGFYLTARIASPYQTPVPVRALSGLTVTPAFIPAGQTSVECFITAPANPQMTDTGLYEPTGNPNPVFITIHHLNRRSLYMNLNAPAHIRGGIASTGFLNPPMYNNLGVWYPLTFTGHTFTVTAFDYDHPEISVPCEGGVSGASGFLGPAFVQFLLPAANRRVRLRVTTDDGIVGDSGLIEVHANTNADGDGIDDLVEAALQRPADQFHASPLTFESGAFGVRAVLGSRPLNLQGWTVVIETSADLQTWTTAPAADTTNTPNVDGTTERVAVLLPAGTGKYYARLKAVMP